jgi:Tfp pilus assembly protein PilO
MVEVTVVLLALVGALALGYFLGLAHQLEMVQELERELAQAQRVQAQVSVRAWELPQVRAKELE